MIQKPFYSLHSVAVVATEPKSGRCMGQSTNRFYGLFSTRNRSR